MEGAGLAMKMIDELRNPEGAFVKIYYDNPDFSGHNNSIVVGNVYERNGERTFYGDSLIDCLEQAIKAKESAS